MFARINTCFAAMGCGAFRRPFIKADSAVTSTSNQDHLAEDEAREADDCKQDVPMISITVQLLSGSQELVEVPASGIVRDLQFAIEVAMGIPACTQRLAFGEQLLDDTDHALGDTGLHDGAIVSVVRGPPNFCGWWRYVDELASKGMFTFELHRSDDESDLGARIWTDGSVTPAKLSVKADHQQIVLTEEHPAISNLYEGHLSNDGRVITGRWTCTKEGRTCGHDFSTGDCGNFSLERVS